MVDGTSDQRVALAKAQFKSGAYDAAARAFAEIFAATGDAKMLNWQGLSLRKAGHAVEAEAAYRQALELSPNDTRVQVNLAILIADSNPRKAMLTLSKFYRKNPNIDIAIHMVLLSLRERDYLNAGLALLRISPKDRHLLKLGAKQDYAIFHEGALIAWAKMQYKEALMLREGAWALNPITWEQAVPAQDCPDAIPALRYSRDQPSPRYHILAEQYGMMHTNAAQASTGIGEFAGTRMNFLYAPVIRSFLRSHQVATLLDYGGGRGLQYQSVVQPDGFQFGGLAEYYGAERAASFDAGWPVECPYPAGQSFDAVVSCDVLEHIDEADLPWVIDELFAFARKAIFVAIGTYPAAKILPNGENAHCTIKPSSWWRPLFAAAARRHPGVHYRVLNVTTNNCTSFDGFEGIG